MPTDLTVLQAKRFGVFSCSKENTLIEAAQRMVEEDISALVVVDENGFLAGIITRTDMMRALVSMEDWEKHKVSSLMSPEVVTVTAQTNLLRVAEILLDHKFIGLLPSGKKEERSAPSPSYQRRILFITW